MIEPKHVNAFAVPNQLKILMASNNDWVVPATADERRFFALNVSSCHKDDRAYFQPLVEAIKSGELASFLYDLLALDLAGFDHRNPPHTRALDEQKLLTNDSFESFWIDCLTEGAIGGQEDMSGAWPKAIECRELHAAYVRYAHEHGDRYPVPTAYLSKKLAASLPVSFKTTKPHGGPRRYLLPPLEACRAAFLETMKIKGEWEWPAVEPEEADGEDGDQSDF
jgi:hypothetical protein